MSVVQPNSSKLRLHFIIPLLSLFRRSLPLKNLLRLTLRVPRLRINFGIQFQIVSFFRWWVDQNIHTGFLLY